MVGFVGIGEEMTQMKKVRPPNSLIFISDIEGDEPIDFTNVKTIMSNSTCIAVCCLNSQDGPTEVTLGEVGEVNPGGEPAFNGDLATPKKLVIISTSDRKTLLEMPVQSEQTRVKVWINRETSPDKILVGLQPTEL